MNTITLNNEMTLTFPDSFRVMDASEREKLNFIEEGQGECLQDKEHHILISIGWKPLGAFISFLIGTKDAAKNMKLAIRNAMQQYGFTDNGSRQISLVQETAEGFCYEYEAQSIPMYGESYVVKHSKTFYYLNCYGRQESKEECKEIWYDILASVRWI